MTEQCNWVWGLATGYPNPVEANGSKMENSHQALWRNSSEAASEPFQGYMTSNFRSGLMRYYENSGVVFLLCTVRLEQLKICRQFWWKIWAFSCLTLALLFRDWTSPHSNHIWYYVALVKYSTGSENEVPMQVCWYREELELGVELLLWTQIRELRKFGHLTMSGATG